VFTLREALDNIKERDDRRSGLKIRKMGII
jgi:hypothetical protein